MENQTDHPAFLFIEQTIMQALNSWALQNKAVTTFFQKYDDSAYLKEVAPGRNRAIYLLGHLIAVNDGLLPLFGLGERLFPELEIPFIKSPDKTVADLPTVAELKEHWETLNTALAGHFNQLTAGQWLDRHMAVSEEAFKQNPLRNKLNALMGRTMHQNYHLGQLNLLQP